ncbi:hypothetical protein BRC81_07085 [Halobacteriales archaeon QS_1_68_20]|nr:MAG: hypothetical protein BRC81_07085 [Halobacteriales archaeon QS_1_68_20]
MTADRTDEGHRVTSDPETVESWARDYDVVPVGTPGEEPTVRFLPRSGAEKEMAEHEPMEWSEFHEEFERRDLALVDRGEGEEGWRYDLLERDLIAERAALDDEEIQEQLLEGETVTTTVTETQVIEAEITETETIEHEVVDRQLVDSKVVGRELVEREFGDQILDADGLAAWLDERRVDEDPLTDVLDEEMGLYETEYERGYEDADMEQGLITVEVRDTMSVTREDLERITIESRITDTDVTETDTLAEDRIEASVDAEGIQRDILESGVVAGDADVDTVLQGDHLQTEIGDGTMTSELYQRRIVEEEVVQEHELAFGVVADQLLSTDIGPSQVLDAEIAERTEIETAGAEPVETGTTETAEMDESAAAPAMEEDTATADVGETTPDEGARTVPASRDQGKDVVDASGQKVGMVAEVDNDMLYVDPHPSFTDKIKAALDWGDVDEDAYPVESENVRRIDNEVVLSVERPEDAENT